MTPAERVETPQTPQQICAKAAELIRRDGWAQHWTMTSDGRHCLVGALNATPGSSAMHREAAKRVYELVSDDWLTLTSFNDAEGRTVEEVLSVLDAAGETT